MNPLVNDNDIVTSLHKNIETETMISFPPYAKEYTI